ncbi:MAG: hypothetical protein KME11_22495 [Timaviella obliquedivisa GSE-PSE-MK23-08B]|jgi:hypothetical protein|nr:hypothetical protein [Timaviella obliquedivisa GSE-PSE-MK23-08B]
MDGISCIALLSKNAEGFTVSNPGVTLPPALNEPKFPNPIASAIVAKNDLPKSNRAPDPNTISFGFHPAQLHSAPATAYSLASANL